jgi:hypothetical protein
MIAGAAAGELVDCGEGPPDPAWGEERTIRAAVLRHLLITEEWPVDAKGVRLRGARIGGLLDLEATVVRCPLALEECYLEANEPARLDYASASRVTLARCHLAGLSGWMLTARALGLSGSTFTDQLYLRNADIAGNLSCVGAHLTGADSDGNALDADGLKVGGDVFLRGGFTAAGAVRLSGADITGNFECDGAQLTGADSHGNALVADGLKVGGDVFLIDMFTAAGAVRLPGADITGNLECDGAKLTGASTDGDALLADGLKTGGNVFLRGGFTAAGTVSLFSARVGGSVDLMPTALAKDPKVGLNAAGAQIAGILRWAPASAVSGQVNLEDASVGRLDDDWRSGRSNGYWPTGGRLRLDGFTYGRFGGQQQATVEQRLAWIRSQYQQGPARSTAEFATQPYEHLAAVYQQAGQDSEARKVAIARRTNLRKYGDLNWYRWFGNWFLDWSIKYGYQTWRAAILLAAVFGIFWVLTILAQQHHLIAWVGDIPGLHIVPSATRCTSAYPCFYPFGYTVDTVIPFLNLRQADFWGPDGSSPWGVAFTVATWVATGLGWALAYLIGTGYGGLYRRD